MEEGSFSLSNSDQKYLCPPKSNLPWKQNNKYVLKKPLKKYSAHHSLDLNVRLIRSNDSKNKGWRTEEM